MAILGFALLFPLPVAQACYDECERDCNKGYWGDVLVCWAEFGLCEGTCLLATAGWGLALCTAYCGFQAWQCESDADEAYDECEQGCQNEEPCEDENGDDDGGSDDMIV